MIKIIATMSVKAENSEDFKAIAKELVAKSAAEEGNISYSLNVSQNDPSCFAIVEFWKDQAAIDFHNATEHFTTLLPKLAELCDGEVGIEQFDTIEF
ncbi:MAG: antibiotic biosynthesis monooxygenase [Propionibacteriaceae bacterium]|uniref:Antibiotic biosynthesis monooxygenase domain n=1 Tax=Propionibacterium ruminifibrarum TaxID=1962131 RepID=A0A375HZ54_9ACTN|nr:putative quinol monooxygenase [Propionibacterium ruminifibrarum]MBE6477260.1 antibiotic biosynthesis monooxygenase [Propionibacteriaceae bacterium]SPF67614.1 Antibiotic biosynthesis monooxygenase domain [Propionibacterium ruminifibrarum]